MSDTLYRTHSNLTLIGAGPVTSDQLDRSLALAPELLAADGGADQARDLGHSVLSVIGDLDSLTNREYWQKSGTSVNRIEEQTTTDFEKCLYCIEASLILGVGFLNGRVDHELAAFSSLLTYASRRIVLLGSHDVCFLSPPELRIELPVATRFSLFPLVEHAATACSGLEWPVDGLLMGPGKRIGTSNRTISEDVHLSFDIPGMLICLPDHCLVQAVRAVENAVPW